MIPVLDLNGQVVLDHDEFPRPGTTVESLAGLKPSFAAIGDMGGFDAVALQKYHWVEKINHVHTPGNSSGIVDGAALMVIGSEQAGTRPRPHAAGPHRRDRRRRPRSRRSCSPVPAPSARKALAKAGLTIDDIDLFEVNEAFAAVVLKFMQDIDVPHEKVNVNGGAIALGHPLGATGAMILGTLIDELERRDLQLRPGHAVRRRRHGRRDDCGACLNAPSEHQRSAAST